LLQPILQSKVKDLAFRCNGKFPRVTSKHEAPEFVLWRDACKDPALIHAIKWPGVKSECRALEKVVRSYGNRVGLLCDLCRSTIVFASVHDLRSCLDSILKDRDLEIIRIKNRLALDYNSHISCGYRDVGICLRIRKELTDKYAIDQHICELQLVLEQFAKLKTDDGHKNYIRYRDLRAE